MDSQSALAAESNSANARPGDDPALFYFGNSKSILCCEVPRIKVEPISCHKDWSRESRGSSPALSTSDFFYSTTVNASNIFTQLLPKR